MHTFQAEAAIRRQHPDRLEADVAVIEANGDVYEIWAVLQKSGEIEIVGKDEVMHYLNQRYSPADFSRKVREAILSGYPWEW